MYQWKPLVLSSLDSCWRRKRMIMEDSTLVLVTENIIHAHQSASRKSFNVVSLQLKVCRRYWWFLLMHINKQRQTGSCLPFQILRPYLCIDSFPRCIFCHLINKYLAPHSQTVPDHEKLSSTGPYQTSEIKAGSPPVQGPGTQVTDQSGFALSSVGYSHLSWPWQECLIPINASECHSLLIGHTGMVMLVLLALQTICENQMS